MSEQTTMLTPGQVLDLLYEWRFDEAVAGTSRMFKPYREPVLKMANDFCGYTEVEIQELRLSEDADEETCLLYTSDAADE